MRRTQIKGERTLGEGTRGRMDPIPPINYMHEMKVEIWVVEGSFNMFERGTQATSRLETGRLLIVNL